MMTTKCSFDFNFFLPSLLIVQHLTLPKLSRMLHSTNANSSHTSDNEKVFKTTLHPALQQEKSVDGKGKTDGPLSMMELVVEVSDILQKAKVGGSTSLCVCTNENG